VTPYRLTRGQLLADLYQAYCDACRHKRGKSCVAAYASRLDENLNALCDELWERRYRPRPSSCFIITDPKRREVFAAEFSDRIVHHLYYNYTHEIYERTFVADSYSCIRGRGTHYGICRLRHHIEQESQNYSEPCWVLKLDIRGYFMHIDRVRLLEVCRRRLSAMASHRVGGGDGRRWCEVADMDFVDYLTETMVLLDPVENCRIEGSAADWAALPHDKSLFHSPPGCGLPIGNLTSQLFSNVYLGEFDDYMKRTLHCRHYGRYVDDAFVVSADRGYLRSIVPKARSFLHDELGLALHEGKLSVSDVRAGVEFVGAYLKPHRTLVSNGTLRRMRGKLDLLQREADAGTADVAHMESSLNSFLGVLSHHRSHALCVRLMLEEHDFSAYGRFDSQLRHFVPHAAAKRPPGGGFSFT